MSLLFLTVIFLMTVSGSVEVEVLYNSDNHPHHLVTFQKVPDTEGGHIYTQIALEKATTNLPVYRYHPDRNIGAISDKWRNPPHSHYLDTAHILPLGRD